MLEQGKSCQRLAEPPVGVRGQSVDPLPYGPIGKPTKMTSFQLLLICGSNGQRSPHELEGVTASKEHSLRPPDCSLERIAPH